MDNEQSMEFARKHLKEGAQELLEYDRIGILKSGRVRELANLWYETAGYYSLSIAESAFKTAALEAAV